MRRLVAREFGRPHERHVATQRPSRLGNRRIVGGENQPIERARCVRRFDRVGDEGLAGERSEVLAREPFRTAAGRDDAEDFQRCQANSVIWHLVIGSLLVDRSIDQSDSDDQVTECK